MKVTRRIILALLLAAAVFLVCGCAGRGPVIHYVLPDGFSGIAIVRGEQPTGTKIIATNNVITLVFPASGILDIQGPLPTLNWHEAHARYASGKSLPTGGPPGSIPDGEVALRSLGMKDKEDWFVVGTLDDVVPGMRKKHGVTIPFP